MIYPELFGDVPLTEAELQARVQATVEREWPAWRRERAMREQGEALVDLNGFFAELSEEVDEARIHHDNLATTAEAEWIANEEAAAAARAAAIEAGMSGVE